MRRAVFLLFLCALAGCMSTAVVVRDPKSGQTEKCTATFNGLTMIASGHCTDGTSAEGKMDGKDKGKMTARDRHGAVVTCGPEFNGAICWPSAEHYKPAPVWE